MFFPGWANGLPSLILVPVTALQLMAAALGEPGVVGVAISTVAQSDPGKQFGGTIPL